MKNDFKGFIEDFFKGRVDDLLNDYATTVFKNQNKEISNRMDKLVGSLSPEQKELLNNYNDAMHLYFSTVLAEIYRQGVTDGLSLLNILGGENRD